MNEDVAASPYPERLKCLTCGEAWFRADLAAPDLVVITCGQCDRTVISDYDIAEAEMPFAKMS